MNAGTATTVEISNRRPGTRAAVESCPNAVAFHPQCEASAPGVRSGALGILPSPGSPPALHKHAATQSVAKAAPSLARSVSGSERSLRVWLGMLLHASTPLAVISA
jgi:hypothetical protein